MEQQLIAIGIFMWTGPERRSDRYGMVYPSNENFEETHNMRVSFDRQLAESFVGKNVKLSCKVLETRQSGHAGDQHLGLFPETPEIGEMIELGIGPFHMEPNPYAERGFSIGIKPSDGRSEFWLDPKPWYRLHDQTVEFYIEETDEPEHPAPVFDTNYGESAISNGDGTYQAKTKKTKGGLAPHIERLSDDMFLITPPSCDGNKGESFNLITEDTP